MYRGSNTITRKKNANINLINFREEKLNVLENINNITIKKLLVFIFKMINISLIDFNN